MSILGISCGFHDAALSILSKEGEILFASSSERYSRIKNDPQICRSLVNAIQEYSIDSIAYYEIPLMHQARKLISGQGIVLKNTLTSNILIDQLGLNGLDISEIPYRRYNHHLSHAAAGFQTSPFNSAAVVVIDAIGEFETITIYQAQYDKKGNARYKKLWRQYYPHSIGLFYSAVTKYVGLKPMDEEYITMGMAAYGNMAACGGEMYDKFIKDVYNVEFKENLLIGINQTLAGRKEDAAAAAQWITENMINAVMSRAQELTGEDNLVYMGGVALNCLANRNLGNYFKNIWIMPNPGDSGSSLGAAALAFKKKVDWKDAYLGYEIPGPYPVNNIIANLLSDGIVGVASGRAEFGPRALGNRSLLADPRIPDIKQRVNDIKQRQQFRPFAPAILEEHVDDYFRMPRGFTNSRYMQVVADCRLPDLYPAICHVDGTSRVQTVPADGSGFRRLLEAWYHVSGCPMLLNTSLNIRGEPMVNDRRDADRFQRRYKITVCS